MNLRLNERWLEATWQILPPDRFLQAVSEDLTSGHLVNVQRFFARSVFTIRKKLSHESDQAQQDLFKNAIKSVSYFIRTCVKCVCTQVLRVLVFFCILLLIAHFSVIGVSSFEFAAADDETQDNFATPCAPCLKKPSQILPHCCMPCTCHFSHCAIIFISNRLVLILAGALFYGTVTFRKFTSV